MQNMQNLVVALEPFLKRVVSKVLPYLYELKYIPYTPYLLIIYV